MYVHPFMLDSHTNYFNVIDIHVFVNPDNCLYHINIDCKYYADQKFRKIWNKGLEIYFIYCMFFINHVNFNKYDNPKRF